MRIHRVPGASLPSSKFVALEATLKEENEVGPRMDRGRFAPTYNGSVRRERSLWGRGPGPSSTLIWIIRDGSESSAY